MKKKILNVCHIVLTIIYLCPASIVLCLILPVQTIINVLFNGFVMFFKAVEEKYCHDGVSRMFKETMDSL